MPRPRGWLALLDLPARCIVPMRIAMRSKPSSSLFPSFLSFHVRSARYLGAGRPGSSLIPGLNKVKFIIPFSNPHRQTRTRMDHHQRRCRPGANQTSRTRNLQSEDSPRAASTSEQASSSAAACAHVSGAWQGGGGASKQASKRAAASLRQTPIQLAQMKPSPANQAAAAEAGAEPTKEASVASASARPLPSAARGLSECPCRSDFKPEVRQLGFCGGAGARSS